MHGIQSSVGRRRLQDKARRGKNQALHIHILSSYVCDIPLRFPKRLRHPINHDAVASQGGVAWRFPNPSCPHKNDPRYYHALASRPGARGRACGRSRGGGDVTISDKTGGGLAHCFYAKHCMSTFPLAPRVRVGSRMKECQRRFLTASQERQAEYQATRSGALPKKTFETMNGLRGLAAIIIVIWHGGSDWFGILWLPNSYLAVDLFFVLS